MPEFVLIPAPVTTTTLRALSNAFAISWSESPDSGWTCCVGISAVGAPQARQSLPERARVWSCKGVFYTKIKGPRLW